MRVNRSWRGEQCRISDLNAADDPFRRSEGPSIRSPYNGEKFYSSLAETPQGRIDAATADQMTLPISAIAAAAAANKFKAPVSINFLALLKVALARFNELEREKSSAADERNEQDAIHEQHESWIGGKNPDGSLKEWKGNDPNEDRPRDDSQA